MYVYNINVYLIVYNIYLYMCVCLIFYSDEHRCKSRGIKLAVTFC